MDIFKAYQVEATPFLEISQVQSPFPRAPSASLREGVRGNAETLGLRYTIIGDWAAGQRPESHDCSGPFINRNHLKRRYL